VKILLDHNLDWRLSRYLPNHEVVSARQRGWDSYRNGRLLTVAEAEGFEVLLTGDTNVNYQQNFSFRSICLIVLRAYNNKRKTHIEMMPDVNQVLLSIQPGEVVEVFHKDVKP
jgi:hypothetical protein